MYWMNYYYKTASLCIAFTDAAKDIMKVAERKGENIVE